MEVVVSGMGDWQWLCMVTLFLASVVTLIIYLVLYFSNEPPVGKTHLGHVDSEEADGILCWVLSLKSWKSQWRKAWLRGLNEEARRSQVCLCVCIFVSLPKKERKRDCCGLFLLIVLLLWYFVPLIRAGFS